MKLLNRERAAIAPSKLTQYLLNVQHKRGSTKARSLVRFGYSVSNWQQLEADIRRYHLDADVDTMRTTSYGVRYEISAFLQIPTRESLRVRTVWQIDHGSDFPRLITLVPD